MFTVQKCDSDVLHKIKSHMKSEHKIKEKDNGHGIYAELNMSSKYICERLCEMGLNNRKSYGFDFKKTCFLCSIGI